MPVPLVSAVYVALLAASPAETKPVIAVFAIDDQSKRLKTQDRRQLSTYLSGRIAAGGAFKVVPEDALKSALAGKKAESYKACFESACQIEIGNELSAEKTLHTTVIAIGSQCAVTATLFDLRTAASEKAATEKAVCKVDALVTAIEKVAEKLSEAAPVVEKKPEQQEKKPEVAQGEVPTPGAPSLVVDVKTRKLDRHQNAAGTARLSADALAPLKLEASGEGGYGFNATIEDPTKPVGFHLGCFDDRGPHRVNWSFTVVDRSGARSQVIVVPVECTEKTPSDLRVESVQVDTTDVLPGMTANGKVSYAHEGSGPVTVEVWGDKPGYGFNGEMAANATEMGFTLGCHSDRGPHDVKWGFVVRDARGRGSEPEYVTVHCK